MAADRSKTTRDTRARTSDPHGEGSIALSPTRCIRSAIGIAPAARDPLVSPIRCRPTFRRCPKCMSTAPDARRNHCWPRQANPLLRQTARCRSRRHVRRTPACQVEIQRGRRATLRSRRNGDLPAIEFAEATHDGQAQAAALADLGTSHAALEQPRHLPADAGSGGLDGDAALTDRDRPRPSLCRRGAYLAAACHCAFNPRRRGVWALSLGRRATWPCTRQPARARTVAGPGACPTSRNRWRRCRREVPHPDRSSQRSYSCPPTDTW